MPIPRSAIEEPFVRWLAARVAPARREAVAAVARRLVQARAEGHTWISASLERDPGWEGLIEITAGRAAFPALRQAERRIAAALRTRALLPPRPVSAAQAAFIAALYQGSPDPQQPLAVRRACERHLVVVTGGPGRGKTTTVVRALAACLLAGDRRVRLAAPTGRAARRLHQAVLAALPQLQAAGLDAKALALLHTAAESATTVHRLLGYRPDSDRFRHDRNAPLPADLVVIDEASMLDLPLAEALLDGVAPESTLILLGDADQLPCVGSGAVFADLVAAAAHSLPETCVTLVHDWRTDPAAQRLRQLAEAVRIGDAPAALAALAAGHDDARLVSVPSTAAVIEHLATMRAGLRSATTATEALTALDSGRVLCALREGPSGVAAWNRRLATAGPRPLLVTANDPTLQLANGDPGVVANFSGESQAWFPGDSAPRALPLSRLPAHDDAWAMTVHKAQGSEYQDVVVMMPTAPHPLVDRPLLYTALTRARARVLLIGSPASLTAALAVSGRRHTCLREDLAS